MLSMLQKEPSIQICAVECGAKCCTNPGIAVLSDDEEQRLRALKPDAPFALGSDGRWALFLKPDGCAFLTENKTCSIYAQRPSACRAFPIKPTSYCLLWSS